MGVEGAETPGRGPEDKNVPTEMNLHPNERPIMRFPGDLLEPMTEKIHSRNLGHLVLQPPDLMLSLPPQDPTAVQIPSGDRGDPT